jgi:hypothetical protein
MMAPHEFRRIAVTETALIPHPRAIPAVRLELRAGAELAPDGPGLNLSYRLRGALNYLAIPPGAAPHRADALWEGTCFEAFVATAGGEGYLELNFSPSTEWAAYAFERYRHGMRPVELARPPVVAVARGIDELTVTASVDLGGATEARWPWRVALCAVVAEAAGGRSYWALRHTKPKPDFHDAAGFALSFDGSAR